MTPAEIRKEILDILEDIAPDEDLGELQDAVPFREQLELDSMDFLDIVMHSGDLELWLEECRVEDGSDIDGKTAKEAAIRTRTGSNVLAIRRHDQGAILTNPPSEMRFEPGEILIALGTHEQLQTLAELAGDRKA